MRVTRLNSSRRRWLERTYPASGYGPDGHAQVDEQTGRSRIHEGIARSSAGHVEDLDVSSQQRHAVIVEEALENALECRSAEQGRATFVECIAMQNRIEGWSPTYVGRISGKDRD